jgi:hypothetical protein
MVRFEPTVVSTTALGAGTNSNHGVSPDVNELINIGCCRDTERSNRAGEQRFVEEVVKQKGRNGKVYWFVPLPHPPTL